MKKLMWLILISLSLLVSYSLANSLNPCMPPIGSHYDSSIRVDAMVSDCTPALQAQYQQQQNQQSQQQNQQPLTPTQRCQNQYWPNVVMKYNDSGTPYCDCANGYGWLNSSDSNSCVLLPPDTYNTNNGWDNTCSDPNSYLANDWTCKCNEWYGVYKAWSSCMTKNEYCQQTYWNSSYVSWNSCIWSQVKSYSSELQSAYKYAYSRGITTQSSIQTADMNGSLTRSNMAKMMTNYAKEVLGKTANTSLECNFTDIGNQTNELQGYIKEVCQLWLMGQGLTKFDPNGIVTRAEFGTVLSRSLYGNEYDWGKPYYTNHLQALKSDWVMSDISKPNSSEIRWFVMLMLQRASNLSNASTGNNSITGAVDCNSPSIIVSCTMGLNTCPKECLWNTSNPDCSKTNSIMGGCLQQ